MGHGGDISVVGAIDSSVFNLVSVEVPELDVLGTSGTEFVRSGLSSEADIIDLVSVSLGLVFLLASGGIEHKDGMVIGHVDGSKLSAVGRDGNALNTTGSLGHDGASHLFTSHGVPGEDEWDGSTLSSNSELTVRRNGEGHDVIVVTVELTVSLSSGIVSLTTSEEALSVRLVVEDNTDSSSHVGSLLLAVEVDVLARVSTSVSIDVLESV